MNHEINPTTQDASSDYYPTTLWTCIFLAQADTERSEEAWKTLLEHYRGPVQWRIEKYLKEYDPGNLVDEFIGLRFWRQLIPAADRAKGRFRDLLAKALRQFIYDQLRKIYAKKRGAGEKAVELDPEGMERQGSLATTVDFGQELDRDVANRLMQRAVESTRRAFLAQRTKRSIPGTVSPEQEFEMLLGKKAHLPLAELAKALGKSAGAVKVDRSRWQEIFRNSIKHEVAQLVAPEEVEAEMRYLLALLGNNPK